MPRSSRRSGPAPSSRSAPAPTRTAAPPQQQQRAAPQHQGYRSGVPAAGAAGSNAPAHHSQQQAHGQVPATMPQSGGGPGIMGQIAANAASMAIGSTAARGISHAMGWGGSGGGQQVAEAAPSSADPQTVNNPYGDNGYAQQQQQQPGQQCQLFATDFAKCLQATNGEQAPCQYFLDQFRACQATHAQ